MTHRQVDPPRLVDVAAAAGEPAWIGWLMAWLRRPNGWYGFVRAHGETSGGSWVPASRLAVRRLDEDTVRALGGYPMGPDGEPVLDP